MKILKIIALTWVAFSACLIVYGIGSNLIEIYNYEMPLIDGAHICGGKYTKLEVVGRLEPELIITCLSDYTVTLAFPSDKTSDLRGKIMLGNFGPDWPPKMKPLKQ